MDYLFFDTHCIEEIECEQLMACVMNKAVEGFCGAEFLNFFLVI